MANNAPEWEGSLKGKNFMEKLGFGLYPAGYDRRVHGPYCPDRYYGPKDTPLSEVKLSELPKWIGRREKSIFSIGQLFSRSEFRYHRKFMAPNRARPGLWLWHSILVISALSYLNHYSHVQEHKHFKYH